MSAMFARSGLTQWTKARLEYRRSNLLSRRAQAVAILQSAIVRTMETHEVVLDNMHKDRETLARSPPGTRAGGSLQIPSWSVSVILHDRPQRAYLESSGTPVDKLDGPLCSDIADGSIDVLGDNVSSVKQTTSHVLALPWVALDHLVVALEARDGHFRDRVGLVEGCL